MEKEISHPMFKIYKKNFGFFLRFIAFVFVFDLLSVQVKIVSLFEKFSKFI